MIKIAIQEQDEKPKRRRLSTAENGDKPRKRQKSATGGRKKQVKKEVDGVKKEVETPQQDSNAQAKLAVKTEEPEKEDKEEAPAPTLEEASVCSIAA